MAALDFHTVPSALHGPQAESPLDFFQDSPPPLIQSQLLGPCEVDDPLWAKMSTASVANKKRKKTDTKPQLQLSKRLNEKRRREQENHYIEELAELISASFADMSSLSVKPDKCAILQETVTQIKKIKDQESSSGGSDAVQQGEVSSSRPNVLNNELLGTLLLEALEGFLFVVNTEGKVEYVTDHVSKFIKYSVEEVLDISIYNILHVGDHAKFSHCLLPPGWSDSSQPQPRNKTFNCRFLVKPLDEPHETMDQKQQRDPKYETMLISCTQVPYKFRGDGGGGASDDEGGGDTGPCLMCVARRITPSEKHTPFCSLGAPPEQFSMRLDTLGNIIEVDTSNASPVPFPYSQYINKELKGRSLRELCHTGDLNKLSAHLKETLNSGKSTSDIYRLKVGPEKYVHVQTKSKLFMGSPHTPPDFITAIHSITGDIETTDCLSGAGTAGDSNCGIGDGSSQMSGVGGPLLSSVNGAIASSRTGSAELRPSSAGHTPTSADLSNTITLSNPTFTSVTLNSNELGFELDIFPSSTWDLVSEDRYGSSASPLYSSSQSTVGFDFDSPVLSGPTAEQPVVSEPSTVITGEQNETESAKLRDLLTKRPTSQDSSQDSAEITKHRILKNLLKDDEEDVKPVISNTSQNNNMLLKLLNDKSDEDDDSEGKAGLKKHNELLHHLLKEEASQESHQVSDDPLFKSLSASSSPAGVVSDRMGRKRPSSEEDDHGGKRGLLDHSQAPPPPPPQVMQQQAQRQSSGSRLCEKNKMLAMLLAKQPSTPATIPPIPASVISATPQDKMPRLVRPPTSSATVWSGGSVRPTGRLINRQHSLPTSAASPASSPLSSHVVGGLQINQSWDQSDPILSDLLDQVIEFVPETDSQALINMMTAETPVTMGNTSTVSVPGYSPEMLSEKMAINAIQKSLMQCESAVKSPIYSNSSVMSSQQQQQQFPPPPMYQQQRQRFQVQSLQTQQVSRQPNQFLVNQQQQQVLLQQRSKIMLQQIQQQQLQQKQRLLQQQQQQQLLIPSNAAAAAQDPGLHNIGSLINDSVAPNVALQRSTSVESQLSPVGNYSGSTSLSNLSATSQISPSPRQQPYSPQPFSPVSYQQQQPQSQQQQSGGTGGPQVSQQSRLSPVSLNSYQQSQLSPRVSQGGFSGNPGNTWSQQQASRLSLQQQQNPMLNAQLAAGSSGFAAGGGGPPRSAGTAPNTGGATPGGFLPSVRSLTSPGSRQSPFPPEPSPTSATSYQFRMQRSISSSPTNQLPGGFSGMGGMRYSSPMGYPHHPPDYQEYHMHHHGNSATNVGYHPAQHNNHRTLPPHPSPGGGSNGVTEYVRQELRAMVGARTNVGPPRPPHQNPDLDDLAITFNMSPPVSENSKLWGNIGEMSASSPQQPAASPHTPRNPVDEVSRSDAKSSLLQKLLSE